MLKMRTSKFQSIKISTDWTLNRFYHSKTEITILVHKLQKQEIHSGTICKRAKHILDISEVKISLKCGASFPPKVNVFLLSIYGVPDLY